MTLPNCRFGSGRYSHNAERKSQKGTVSFASFPVGFLAGTLHCSVGLVKGCSMIDENCPIGEVRELFAGDRFATEACGCRVVEAARGHAVCEFDISEIHLNAQGNVMGGAIFTLADFALAIACNVGEEPTVAANNSIQYFNATKGSKLIATCNADKSGRSLGFYTVEVSDDLNVPIAKMTATCFRRG